MSSINQIYQVIQPLANIFLNMETASTSKSESASASTSKLESASTSKLESAEELQGENSRRENVAQGSSSQNEEQEGGNQNEAERFTCKECNKICEAKKEFVSHMHHQHNRRYICYTCHKAFKQKSDSRNHFATHSNERKYMCAICEKKFKLTTVLRHHVHQVHSSTYLTCFTCNKKIKYHCFVIIRFNNSKKGLEGYFHHYDKNLTSKHLFQVCFRYFSFLHIYCFIPEILNCYHLEMKQKKRKKK